MKIDDMQVEEVVLEKIRFGLTQAVHPLDLRFEQDYDLRLNRMIEYLTWNLLGKKVETYTHPKTWWDAIKDHWYPRFLKRRFPPQFTTIDRYHICPHINIEWAKDQKPHLWFLSSEFKENSEE